MWNTMLLSRFLPGLALGLLLLLPAPAAAAPGDTPELRCRRAIAGALDRWLTDVTRLHQRCQALVVGGLLSESTDCVAGSVVRDGLLRAEGDVRASLDAACEGASWGLLSYPGPCAPSGSAFGTGSLSSCVDDVGRSAVADLLEVWYPAMLDLTRGAEGACLQAVPKRAAMMLTREIRARLACQLAVESGDAPNDLNCRAQMPPYDGGTGSEAFDKRIYKARRKWLGGMPKACAVSDFQSLGYGTQCPIPFGDGAGLLDLQSCVHGVSRQKILALLDLAFPSAPVCGNGVLQEGEACDEGPSNSDTTANACRSDCTLPVCGDFTTDPGYGESCDDGNAQDLDGCTADCRAEFCGDGVLNDAPPEACDDGNANPNDRCTATCTNAVCGDGAVCSDASCTSGPGGGPEACDLGAQNSDSGLCRMDCSGYRRTCKLTIGVTNAVRIGALTYELSYKDVAGDFLGSGGTVQCTSVVTGGLVSFFDNETRRSVKESVIVNGGLQAPAALAECTWATNAATVSGSAFTASVQDAADPDFEPITANIGVTAVDCQP
jgi:cysteine-rich repeat protein